MINWGEDNCAKNLRRAWEVDGQTGVPGTVTGPLTAAWLRRPLIPTGTACIQLRFDKSHSVEAVAAALQRTVNTHEALRSRLLHRVDGTADVAVLAPGPAVAVVKAAQAGDLGEIGAFVEDAASHGDGQCTPTIVCCGDHAELLLYMPHMFVDGTALAMLTDEVVDRVCGITPTPVRSASVALSEWYSHRSSGTPDQLQDANNRWTAFATADAALVAATDGHRFRGTCAASSSPSPTIVAASLDSSPLPRRRSAPHWESEWCPHRF